MNTQIDLHSVDLPDDGLSLETVPEGTALCTYSSTGTASTASCPVSSAGSVSTAASVCPPAGGLTT
ncbi:thiocillin family RiPP [Streptomyces sp. NBC_01077]|uniref:thiocillin family RiPP n=1 Tax=Streptomyces sp. NBC_01077 TaxID=2903746 RepID=UPI003869F742|nr:thiocillin family RiPP [Streptomyces sp. NBC_01077]WSV43654.1 thiocillin family RiPP [Streptomyces sp. NBC_01077]